MEKKPVKLLICRKCGTKNNYRRKTCRKCGAKIKRRPFAEIAVCAAAMFALMIFFASMAPEEDTYSPESSPVQSTPVEPSLSETTLVPTIEPTVLATPTASPSPVITPSPTPTLVITASPTPTPEPTLEPAPESVNQQSSEPMRVIVTTESVRVYQSPDENSALLGTMKKDSVMILLSIENGWAKVENHNGDIGYTVLSGLTTIPQSEYVNQYTEKEVLRVIVTTDSVNVYEQPDETSKFLGAMKKGSLMRIHEIQNSWAKVENEKGAVGYAKIDGMKVLNEKEFAVQVTPTPKPQNKSYVWYTSGGKSYHSSSKCSNMSNPKKIELSKAKARGLSRCPKCW